MNIYVIIDNMSVHLACSPPCIINYCDCINNHAEVNQILVTIRFPCVRSNLILFASVITVIMGGRVDTRASLVYIYSQEYIHMCRYSESMRREYRESTVDPF